MEISIGELRYEWVEDWAKIPDTRSLREGWAHHAFSVTDSGYIVGAHPGKPRVLFLDSNGTLKRSWDIDLLEIHGITTVQENGKEFLWLVDSGSKPYKRDGYGPNPGLEQTGQVIKTTLDGKVVQRLETPPDNIYESLRYSPTGMAVFEERFGGNGDLWVTDGYGASWIHRYEKNGTYLGKITGEEGPISHFHCPHSVYLDTRRDPRLYIADRGNGFFQVYDLEGHFERSFGSEFLTTPSAMASYEGFLITAELRARITLLDENDKLIGYLGENESVCDVLGWPNQIKDEGKIVPTKQLFPGKFNSPHGMTVDQKGSIYISEWLIGGRYIKLVKC